MAWRPYENLIQGELDNRTRGKKASGGGSPHSGRLGSPNAPNSDTPSALNEYDVLTVKRGGTG